MEKSVINSLQTVDSGTFINADTINKIRTTHQPNSHSNIIYMHKLIYSVCTNLYSCSYFFASVQFSFIYLAPNHNNSCLELHCVLRETPTIRRLPMSRHVATAGKKNVLFRGRNLQQNQAQGVDTICCDSESKRVDY